MPDRVSVCCKLPHGLILRLFRLEDAVGPGFMPGEKRSVEVGERVHIRGNAYEEGERSKVLLVGGYALTDGVPKAFWDEWVKQNHELCSRLGVVRR